MSVGESFALGDRTAVVVGGDAAIRDVVASALTDAGAETSSIPCESFVSGAPGAHSADILVLNCFNAHALAVDPLEEIARLNGSLVTLPWAAMEKFTPAMQPRRWGRVIFLTSDVDADSSIANCTAHRAQSALVQAEARRLAGAGITVNRVIVGACSRDGLADWKSDLASAVRYFASSESSFVTGQTLRLDASFARN